MSVELNGCLSLLLPCSPVVNDSIDDTRWKTSSLVITDGRPEHASNCTRIQVWIGGSAVGRWTCDLQVAGSIPGRWISRNIGQLSLASLRSR